MEIKHPANFKDEKETPLKSVQDKLPQRLLQCTTLAGRLGEHTELLSFNCEAGGNSIFSSNFLRGHMRLDTGSFWNFGYKYQCCIYCCCNYVDLFYSVYIGHVQVGHLNTGLSRPCKQ